MAAFKVVINNEYGGFSLSQAAVDHLVALGYTGDIHRIQRHDPRLVQVVEALKPLGHCKFLEVCEITCPEYVIEEYDGMENIVTRDTFEWNDARIINNP